MVRTTLMVWIIAGRELTASQYWISGPRRGRRTHCDSGLTVGRRRYLLCQSITAGSRTSRSPAIGGLDGPGTPKRWIATVVAV
jgi:hypothetical protein